MNPSEDESGFSDDELNDYDIGDELTDEELEALWADEDVEEEEV